MEPQEGELKEEVELRKAFNIDGNVHLSDQMSNHIIETFITCLLGCPSEEKFETQPPTQHDKMSKLAQRQTVRITFCKNVKETLNAEPKKKSTFKMLLVILLQEMKSHDLFNDSKEMLAKVEHKYSDCQEAKTGPDFKKTSVLRCLLSSSTADVDEGMAAAAEDNARQVKMLSQAGTIWHAACDFKNHRKSWDIVKPVICYVQKHNLSCPWMKGDERGQFGETPLHIALLFNEPTPELMIFFFSLWELCPQLGHVTYEKQTLYEGENILHIAVIKRLGVKYIKQIIDKELEFLQKFSQQSTTTTTTSSSSSSSSSSPTTLMSALIHDRAIGNFFTEPQQTDGACHQLGEYPVCFAACTNQLKVFKYLVELDPNALFLRTADGNTLLHLLILNAFDRNEADAADAKASDPSDDDEGLKIVEKELMRMFDAVIKNMDPKASLQSILSAKERDASSGDGEPLKSVEKALMRMFDAVIETMDSKGCLKSILAAKNRDGYTPLTLAAASGSLECFLHMLERHMSTAWVFGPVKCTKLILTRIDPIDHGMRERDVATAAKGTSAPSSSETDKDTKEAEDGRLRDQEHLRDARLSVLEILVARGRKTLIARSQIDKLVELKWNKYGRHIFHQRLALSLIFTILIIFVTMTDHHHSLPWKVAHSVAATLASLVYLYQFASILFHGAVDLADAVRFFFSPQGVPSIAVRLIHDLIVRRNIRPSSINESSCAVKSVSGFGEETNGKQRKEQKAQEMSKVGASLEATGKKAKQPKEDEETKVKNIGKKAEELYRDVVASTRLEFGRAGWELFFLSTVPPLVLGLSALYLFDTWAPMLPGVYGAVGLAAGLVDSEAVKVLVEVGYAYVSVMSFGNILFHVMGFEKYGQFVLMLLQITRKDLPVFVVIYTIFLFGFGHLHFFASNGLNAGLGEGGDSIARIFNAMLGDMTEEDKKVEEDETADALTTVVTVVNFFFVTVVMMNLLIAMLSSTYESISAEAKENWKLHRATILISIDRHLVATKQEEVWKFWEEEKEEGDSPASPAKAIRFVTFTSNAERMKYICTAEK